MIFIVFDNKSFKVESFQYDHILESILKQGLCDNISEIHLTYKDDDGDFVTIASNDDLFEAKRLVLEELGEDDLKINLKIKKTNKLPSNKTAVQSEQSNSKLNIEEKRDESLDFHGSQLIVHTNVICDSCKITPIIGIRYKCSVCNDYDLCENCENTHDPSHPLIKIISPGSQGPQKSKKQIEKPKLDSKLISDVNIAAGSVCKSGSSLVKIWNIKNTGNIVWPKQLRLVHIGGDNIENFEHRDDTIGRIIRPGEITRIKKRIICPLKPGQYKSQFRFQNPFTKEFFGEPITIQIQVLDESKDEKVNDLDIDFVEGSAFEYQPQLNSIMELGFEASEGLVKMLLQENDGNYNKVLNTLIAIKAAS